MSEIVNTPATKLLMPGLHISCKDRKHIVANIYFKLYRYGLVSKSLEWSKVLIFHKKYFQSVC